MCHNLVEGERSTSVSHVPLKKCQGKWRPGQAHWRVWDVIPAVGVWNFTHSTFHRKVWRSKLVKDEFDSY